ncbi:MAG: DUF3488 and transglutaminase-like domain-containing protein [Candidatus Acidiferrales bacterium]
MASSAHAGAPPLPAVQRYFEVSLYLLVATGVLAVIATGKLDIVTTLLPSAALIYKGIRVFRGRGPELSPRVATWLVLAYFLFFPFDLYLVARSAAAAAPNPELYAALVAAIRLMIFATLVRLFSARTNRDYGFLAVLAVTSMLASAILTVETGFIIALAVFLVLAVSTFVALEIRRSAGGAVSPPVDVGSPLAQRLSRALAVVSVLVALAVLAIGGVIFFLIPRFTAGYLGALNLQPSLATGFSDSVTLGEIGRIKQNTAVVMRIHVQGDAARAADVHWRGIVLTNFDGARWFTTAPEQVILQPSSDGAYSLSTPPLPPADSYVLQYTALVEPLGTDAVFVAPRPQSIRGRFSPVGERSTTGRPSGYLLMDKTGSLFNPYHNETKVRYQGVSLLPMIPYPDLRRASSDYPPEIARMYLQLPSLDPRVPALAAQVTATSSTEFDKASAVETYLKTHYGYTLDLGNQRPKDPLANFLFTRRAGHCEYFATAMTVMLRTQGIPARYVTGFLPGEYNDVGGDYIIRSSDAHAWVEAYFPGYGWITFDPTPPGAGAPSGIFSRLSLYWDWFQFSWSEWVINYDFGHQVTLAQNLQRGSRDLTQHLRALYEHQRDKIIQLLIALDTRTEASPYFLPGVLAFLVALLLYLRGRALAGYVVKRWSLRAGRGGDLTPSLAALEYREMLRLLEKRGWKKSPAQTAVEFAAAIPAPEFASPVAQLTSLYQSARFGDRPASATEMTSLLRSIRDLVRHRQRPAL